MQLLCIVIVALATGALTQKPFPKDCGSCDESKCPDTDMCLAGTTHDRCGCCQVCAKAEFEMCDHPDVKGRPEYGPCGRGLECRVREDQLPDEPMEALCYCVHTQVLCGSDDQTYENLCELEAAKVTKGMEISIQSEGPCRSVPVITVPPQHVKNATGTNAFMVCEARGVPIPAMEWTWTRVDGKTVFLPSDDLHVSVFARGGPEKWQITSWLQVMDLMKKHEGDYTCVAQNELGSTQASARVIVLSDPEHDKRHRHGGKDNDIL